MVINRDHLVNLLDSWLEPQKIKDATINSLQFEGKTEIHKIACTVDVSLESLMVAAEKNIDFLITHHGMIWGGLKTITGLDKKRIEVLVQSQMNLYCSHLPLDIHASLGNNAVIIDILGLKNTHEPFFEVGYIAEYETPISYEEFKNRIQTKINAQLVEMPFSNQAIKRIAVCSGGAGLQLEALFEAHQKGADTLLSGETNSILYHYAKELKINIICAGHYATEVFGVQAVMQKIKEQYSNCSFEFLDLPTGF